MRQGEVACQVEYDQKYAGYIARQDVEVSRLKRLQEKRIPASFDYSSLVQLRTEAREKFAQVRPTPTLLQPTPAQPQPAPLAQPKPTVSDGPAVQGGSGSPFIDFFNQLAAPELAQSQGVTDLVRNNPTAAKIEGAFGLGSLLAPPLAMAGAEGLGLFGAGAAGACSGAAGGCVCWAEANAVKKKRVGASRRAKGMRESNLSEYRKRFKQRQLTRLRVLPALPNTIAAGPNPPHLTHAGGFSWDTSSANSCSSSAAF